MFPRSKMVPPVPCDAIHGIKSRAKDTWKDGSDIDLAVFAPQLSDQEFTQLWNEIDDLPLLFKIDCIHWDKLSNQSLKDKILNEGKLFYSLSE